MSYADDYYGWAMQQAALLRAGRLQDADIENIAEEIESMGKGEKRELVNRLTVLLAHLLKWQAQPGHRGRSWHFTILAQRDQLMDHLIDNPSLKPQMPEAITRAYSRAKMQALDETGLPDSALPSNNPWTQEQIMDPEFWPD